MGEDTVTDKSGLLSSGTSQQAEPAFPPHREAYWARFTHLVIPSFSTAKLRNLYSYSIAECVGSRLYYSHYWYSHVLYKQFITSNSKESVICFSS